MCLLYVDKSPAVVKGAWGPWTDWTECPAQCGLIGVQMRSRACNAKPHLREQQCNGPTVEGRQCKGPECPGTEPLSHPTGLIKVAFINVIVKQIVISQSFVQSLPGF